MAKNDLWSRIYDEISDALDLLDNTTALDGSEDSLGQAELALVRAREAMIADGAPRLIAEAPAMLEALRGIMDGGSWQDDGSFVYYPPTDAPEDGGAIDDASAILARIDGTPTAQPAGAIGEAGPDDAAVIAAANLSRAGLVNAAREAEALEIPIGEAGATSMEGDA